MDKKLALLTGVGRKIGIAAAIANKLAMDDWDLALTYWTRYDERMPWGVQTSDLSQSKKNWRAQAAQSL